MTSDAPLTTFEDVMAFIDGFGTTPDTGGDGVHNGLPPFGFSDEDALLGQLNEFLGLLRDRSTAPRATAVYTECSLLDNNIRLSAAPAAAFKTTKPAPRQKNTYREKMKRELQYLRLRAAEMEEQLTALRHGTAVLSPVERQLISLSWKRIAENQLGAMKESEAENARLKGVVQDHMAMSKSLEQSLGKRLDTAFLADGAKSARKRVRSVQTGRDERFAELANDLDATFDRLDQVMHDSRVTGSATDSARSYRLKTSVSASGVVTPYMELTDTTVTPFHPRLTAEAVWRAVQNQYCRQGANNSSGRQTVYAVQTKGGINCNIVLRKYTDAASRMVVVWRATNECEEYPAGAYVDETGWSVVQPMSGTFGHSSSGSAIRTCVHVMQRHQQPFSILPGLEAVSQQNPSAGVLADLVMASNEQDLLELAKVVESLLLDEGRSSAQRTELLE